MSKESYLIFNQLFNEKKREKGFLLSSKFCAKRIVCLCPGLYAYTVVEQFISGMSGLKSWSLGLNTLGTCLITVCPCLKFVLENCNGTSV